MKARAERDESWFPCYAYARRGFGLEPFDLFWEVVFAGALAVCVRAVPFDFEESIHYSDLTQSLMHVQLSNRHFRVIP